MLHLVTFASQNDSWPPVVRSVLETEIDLLIWSNLIKSIHIILYLSIINVWGICPVAQCNSGTLRWRTQPPCRHDGQPCDLALVVSWLCGYRPPLRHTWSTTYGRGHVNPDDSAIMPLYNNAYTIHVTDLLLLMNLGFYHHYPLSRITMHDDAWSTTIHYILLLFHQYNTTGYFQTNTDLQTSSTIIIETF